jgi:hypothetical protein
MIGDDGAGESESKRESFWFPSFGTKRYRRKNIDCLPLLLRGRFPPLLLFLSPLPFFH